MSKTAEANGKKKAAPKSRKRKTSDVGAASKAGSSPAKRLATDAGGSAANGLGSDAHAAQVAQLKPFVRGELVESVKHMLFGFGDEAEPLDETAELMEDLVVEYVHSMTKKAMELATIKGKLDTECFIFQIRKDPERYARIAELLRANDEFRVALNSGFDPSDEKITKIECESTVVAVSKPSAGLSVISLPSVHGRMLLEPSDVVGESCGSQFDSNSTMMASMRAELPQMSALDKNNGSTVDFRGPSASNGSTTRLQQRTHIQRDEADPPRCDWKSRNSEWMKTRPSASAMVLEKKRKRDEQRKLMNSKKQCTASDGSEYNAADSERDSLDMEEQLTAFVEYNATDMDSLDINPSQDFDGDGETDTATQASQCMQTCSWEDVTDVNQFEEEASEVFDNVIYAPRPASTSADNNTSTYHRPQGESTFSITRPSFMPKAQQESARSLSDDSEGSLSDGFDVAVNLVGKTRTAVEETDSSDGSPTTASKPQWRQRRSVKRDCSFIDNSNCYSVNGRLLLMASPTPVTSNEAIQTSERVIELKDGCFDSSDNAQEIPIRNNDVSSSVSIPASVDTMTSTASLLRPGTIFSGALQPRLVRKRRKVGQLKLDGFLRSKT